MNVDMTRISPAKGNMDMQHSISMHQSHHPNTNMVPPAQEVDTFERSSQIPQLNVYDKTGKLA